MWRFVCYIFDFLKVQNPLFKGLFTSLMAEIAHSGIFILKAVIVVSYAEFMFN